MRATGAVVRLTVSPGAAQRHGLGHLLAQASPQPHQRHVAGDMGGETETRDTCSQGDNYQNQEWLAMTAGVAREQMGQETQEAEPRFYPEQPPHDQGGQHYQNLAAIREQAAIKPRSPRPMSLHVSSASAGVHPQSLPNSQSIQNISQDPEESVNSHPALAYTNNAAINSRGFSNISNLHSTQTLPNSTANSLVRQAMGGSQNILGSNTHSLPLKNSSAVIGNFARINSGRFRPIHPAPSLDRISNISHKNSSDNRSAIRKGPIRKDGSVILSPPKHSPALSQQSGSSDKENSGINTNIWLRPEEECDPVFIEKEPESVCSEVSRVSQIQPRSDKKVSFTLTTVHDINREEGNDMSRQSLDTIDDPDGFIDGAEDILNLNQIDLHQKTSVVGNQVNEAQNHENFLTVVVTFRSFIMIHGAEYRCRISLKMLQIFRMGAI